MQVDLTSSFPVLTNIPTTATWAETTSRRPFSQTGSSYLNIAAGEEALVGMKSRGHYHEDVFGSRAPLNVSSSPADSAICSTQQDTLTATQADDISSAHPSSSLERKAWADVW